MRIASLLDADVVVDAHEDAVVAVSATRKRPAPPSKPEQESGSAEALLSLKDLPGDDKSESDGQKKKRKSTLAIRKEEIDTLMVEARQLEARLAFIRGQTLEITTGGTDELLRNPFRFNDLLREMLHEQQLRFATAHAMMAKVLIANYPPPLHFPIHLRLDKRDRLRTLETIKPKQIRLARRFILERSRGIDLTAPYRVEERFVATNRDGGFLRFGINQLPEATSVKDVYDATLFFTRNLEMTYTESVGYITVREDDDNLDLTSSQHRLVTTTDTSVMIETNSLVFAHYDPEEDYGLVCGTFVDQDDLYPYRPTERLRHDITAVFMVSKYNSQIVVRRWGYDRHRHNEHISVPSDYLEVARENTRQWGDAMIRLIRQRLQGTRTVNDQRRSSGEV
ncbi:hypothetical protein Poli38472_012337 [Pythium oligandrum]|uniref:Uncharacterized protein n=1 Tax=Pythium oligandrum TaxID=41045 RepID=A0A8K1CP47_PYTOL|nr:hypothetical protein Poli38472_012337 [Pythium oligandrum]|eukprot:TMW67221.1 hypothetical protein Poli38472_012337 [Pythium oligandrum]